MAKEFLRLLLVVDGGQLLAQPADGMGKLQGQNLDLLLTTGTVDGENVNRMAQADISLAAGANVDVDISTMVGFNGSAQAFADLAYWHCYAESGIGVLEVSPSAANGLTGDGFFEAPTDGTGQSVKSLKLGQHWIEIWTGAGPVLDATHKQVNFKNTGADPMVVSLAVVGRSV